MSHSIAKIVAVTFGLLLLVVVESSCADKQVIGYVRDSLYHPLIVLANDSLMKAESRDLELGSFIINAFEREGDTVRCQEQIDYEDLYTDELARCCRVSTKVKEDNQYYLMGGSSLSDELVDIDEQVVRGFYQWFSKDEWGRQFLGNPSWLTLPLESLYDSSEVWTEYATDLDHDGALELWIMYKLMRGEKGRMVYEQGQDKAQWICLAIHCYDCD